MGEAKGLEGREVKPTAGEILRLTVGLGALGIVVFGGMGSKVLGVVLLALLIMGGASDG